ncbi:MAG: BrnT family toxin [Rhodospirillaceae bacterium]|nr:BrnT family toxin [Rhodospirillaceae bacterium]
MSFEWDPDKTAHNFAKHGVDFNEAVKIFAGPVIEWADDRWAYGETRLISIGRFREQCLTVVSTWRGENRRIISARKANGKEKRAYRQIHES